MALRSNTMVWVGLGAVGVAVMLAAGRAKAAAAANGGKPAKQPPRLPPDVPQEASFPAEAPPAIEDPLLEPPGPPAPVDLPNPSTDPYIEPPGPPAPLDLQPVHVPSSADPALPPVLDSKIEVQPVQVADKKPSEPSRMVIDVQADDSNYGGSGVAKPSSSTAAPKPPAKRSAAQAARDLHAYVTPLIKAGRASELGFKDNPNAFVKAAQLDMGGVAADGIYGPATRARGKTLIGVTFPPR